MKKIALIINETKFKNRPKNLSKEFQVYGVYLAETLGDTNHYSLYIKLAKTHPRPLLEEVLNFVKGAYNVKSKGKLFMWKLKALKTERALKNEDTSNQLPT